MNRGRETGGNLRESGLFSGCDGDGGAGMDRKRIKDVLEKHLERSSPSTSRGVVSKERERLAAGKLPASLGKAEKVSDGGKRYIFREPSLFFTCFDYLRHCVR
jgi:casein kinase II subunit beta